MTTYGPLVGRILTGLLFLIAGVQKFLNLEGTAGFIASSHLPYPLYLAVASATLEVVAGALIIFGFKTRYAALALALFTIAVNFIFHSVAAGAGQIVFLKDLAIAGGLLYIATYGSGKYSFDKN